MGIQIVELEQPKPIPQAPHIIELGPTQDKIDAANKSLKAWLDKQENPESEAVKVYTSSIIGDYFKVKPSTIYENWDSIAERVTGTKEPKGALDAIATAYEAGKEMVQRYKLEGELVDNPDSGRVPYIKDQIKKIKENSVVSKIKDQNLLLRMATGTAQMIPYTWAVGKYLIPGAAMTVLTKGLAGKGMIASGLTLAASLITATGTAKSFVESANLAGGIVFGDLMDMEDEDGNHIDEEVARTTAKIVRLPYAAIELLSDRLLIPGKSVLGRVFGRMTEKGLKDVLSRSAARATNNAIIEGTHRSLAKKIAVVGAKALATGIGGTLEEVFEEETQDTMQFLANEYAKQITNEITDSDFKPADWDEYKDMFMETLTGTIESTFLLQLPNMLHSMDMKVSKQKKEATKKETVKRDKETKEAIDLYTNADEETANVIIDKWLAEEKKSKVEVSNNTVKTTDSKLDFDVDETRVIIKKGSGDVNKLVEELDKKYPDKMIVYDGKDKKIHSAIENLDPEIAVINKEISKVENILKSTNKELEVTDNEEIKADLQEIKESNEAILNRLRERRAEVTQKPDKPISQMNKGEYIEKVIKPRVVDKVLKSPYAIKLKEQFKRNTKYSDEEIDLAIAVANARAEATGLSLEQWIHKNFENKNDIFLAKETVADRTKGRKVRGITMRNAKTGKAKIGLKPTADFSTWVHELAHVIFNDLTVEEKQKAFDIFAQRRMREIAGEMAKTTDKRKIAKAKQEMETIKNGEWTPEMEENFAYSFESYIRDGKTEHTGLKAIFEKMAKILRKIYESVKFLPDIDDNVRQFYDSILYGKEKAEEYEMLFQNEYETKIKEAVDKGDIVPEKILNQIDQEWAKEELRRRQSELQKMKDFQFLTDMVRNTDNFEDFKNEVDMYMGEYVDKLDSKDTEWLRDFYNTVKKYEVVDINEGNRRWVESLSDDYIDSVIVAVADNIDTEQGSSLPVKLVAQAKRFLKNGTINDKERELIRATLANNPTDFRMYLAGLMEDRDAYEQIQRELAYSKKFGITEIRKDMTLSEKIKLFKEGAKTDTEVNNLLKDAEKEVRSLEKKVEKLEKDLMLEKGEQVIRLAKIRKKFEQQNKEIKNLESKVKQLKKAKEKIKETKKRQALLRKEKAHREQLVRSIMKKPSKAIDLKYRLVIEAIQAGIDKRKLSKAKIEELTNLREFYKEHPDLVGPEVLDYAERTGLFKKHISEFTTPELEFINTEIQMNLAQGRIALEERLRERKERAKADKEMFIKALESGGYTDKRLFSTGKKPVETMKHANLITRRASRIADSLDNGAMFQGSVHKLVIEEIDKAYDREIAKKFERLDKLKEKMNEIGLKKRDIYKLVKVKGQKVSMDEIMDVYAGWKNELKQQALEYGNGIDKEIYDEMMTYMDDKYKALADWIIEEYGENLPRLIEAVYRQSNKNVKEESYYTPIKRNLGTKSADEQEIDQQLLNRQSNVQAILDKGMTEKRKVFSPEHQSEIQLGLVYTWQGEVARQEHYINNADIAYRLNRVLFDRGVAEVANHTGKTEELKELQRYFKRYINPLVYKSNAGLNTVVRHLKDNTAIAYLSLNPVTMFKQLPSLMYYTLYSSPADIMGSVFETMTNWKGVREKMKQYAPQIYHRSMEQFIDSIEAKASARGHHYLAQLGRIGMMGITQFDKVAVTIGWNAVYEKNLRNGRSEEEAGLVATRATLNSQPASAAKDIASLYADDNFLSIFLQFTNQLNQIWNMATYDVPMLLKNKEYLNTVTGSTAILLAAGMMWVISNRRLPEDREDAIDMVSDSFFQSVPWLGREMNNGIDGYNLSLPVLKPVEAVGRTVKLGKKLLNGDDISKREFEGALDSLYEGFAISAGIPYTFGKKLRKGFSNEEPFQTIFFGGTINDK